MASSLDLGQDNQIGEAAETQPNPFWWWAVVALSRSQRQHFNNVPCSVSKAQTLMVSPRHGGGVGGGFTSPVLWHRF